MLIEMITLVVQIGQTHSVSEPPAWDTRLLRSIVSATCHNFCHITNQQMLLFKKVKMATAKGVETPWLASES
jgi:hypothetical protein